MRYPVRPGVPTENGWPMINASGNAVLQVVPAAKRVPLRAGPVATILNAWLIYYNRHIEPIQSQVWGWSADNDVATSNHMSGTAVDIGAPKYPFGRLTMPAHLVNKVNDGLAKFDGVIFWGRRWDYPDEMHYQIGVGPTSPKVTALANRLNAGYLNIYKAAPPPPPKGLTVSEANRIIKEVNNFTRAFNGPISSDLKDVRQQITGGRDAGQYQGWPQLGDRTIVDALALIGEKLGIEGFEAPKL